MNATTYDKSISVFARTMPAPLSPQRKSSARSRHSESLINLDGLRRPRLRNLAPIAPAIDQKHQGRDVAQQSMPGNAHRLRQRQREIALA